MRDAFPKNWQYLKLDLFNNASDQELMRDIEKLKLSVSIKTDKSNDWQYFRAQLNSPKRHYKRGVDKDWDWSHYGSVLKEYDNIVAEYQPERINISKLYQKGYAETRHIIEGLSCCVFRSKDRWISIIYYTDQRIVVELDTNQLSINQKRNNIIATATRRGSSTGYTRQNAKILLG
jgi:hypothetical protein